MSHFRSYMPGDRVDYIGGKQFLDNQGKPLSLKGVVGTVLAKVKGHEDVYSMDFDGDGFIMMGRVLQLHKFTKQEIEKERAEVLVRRRRLVDDE